MIVFDYFNTKHVWRLLGGSLVSKFGDGLAEMLFVVLAYQLSGSDPAGVGVAYGLRFLPYLLLGPLSAKVSSHYPRRAILIWCDTIRLVLACCFAFTLWTGNLSFSALVFYGASVTTIRAFSTPAFFTALRDYSVEKGDLPKINSINQMFTESGMIVGPAIGGYLLYIGAEEFLLVLLDALTFLISLIFIAPLPRKEGGRAFEQGERVISIKAAIVEYYKNLALERKTPGQKAAVYSGALIVFVGGVISVVLPGLALEIVKEDHGIATAMTLLGVGAILGSFLSGKGKTWTLRTLLCCWALYGLSILFIGVLPSQVHLFYLSCLTLGGLGGVVDVAIPSVIQLKSSSDATPVNFATFSTLANISDSVSGFLVAIVAGFVALNSIPIGFGAATFLIAFGLLAAEGQFIKTTSEHR